VSSYEPNFLDIRLESRLLSVEGVYIRMKGVVWGIWVPLGSFVDVQSARHPLHQWFGLRRLCNWSRDWAMIQVWAEFCAALIKRQGLPEYPDRLIGSYERERSTAKNPDT
jgi:hypothetical protein